MRLNELHWFATAAFGLEGIVAAELKRLGMRDVLAQNGGAAFVGSPGDAFRACLWLRSADRVLLVLAQSEARTFEELFQLVKSVPWEEFLPRNARIPVTGKCARSQLMSVPARQSPKKPLWSGCVTPGMWNGFRKPGSVIPSMWPCTGTWRASPWMPVGMR